MEARFWMREKGVSNQSSIQVSDKEVNNTRINSSGDKKHWMRWTKMDKKVFT